MSGPRRTSETLDMLLMSFLTNLEGWSGYDIAVMLRQPVPFIWPVKHSQIYPALAALEKRGDIAGEWIEQRGRPNKKVYALSEQGRRRLIAWLEEPRTSLSEDQAMLTTYNFALIGAPTALRALAVYRRQCEAERLQLEERWGKVGRKVVLRRDRVVGIRSVYEFATKTREARVQWCDWAIATIEAESAEAADTQPKAGVSARRRA